MENKEWLAIQNFASQNLGWLISSGHRACSGCGAVGGLKLVLDALGPEAIIVIPASCTSVYSGLFPFSALKVPVVHTPFASAAATASGIARMLRRQNRPGVVTCWGGDGGTLDIGFQALSGACERGEDFIYICYDNEAYMNTGIQRSSATPCGAWTSTTPLPIVKTEPKKDIDAILAAHRISYIATINAAFLDDFYRKVKTAKGKSGTRFLHLCSPCPPGWKYDPRYSVKLSRLAVLSCFSPLFEVEGGRKWALSFDPGDKKASVAEYFGVGRDWSQDRFAHLGVADIEKIQKDVDDAWEELKEKCKKKEG